MGLINKMGGTCAGAHDSNSFKEVITMGGIPKLDSLTFQGVFNENLFEIQNEEKEKILSLESEAAWLRDPTDGERKLFLSALTKSKYDGRGKRDCPIDIVIALDNSGSMNGNLGKSTDSCLSLAIKAIEKLVDQMSNEDRIGITSINTHSVLISKLDYKSNLLGIKNKLKEIKADSGTDLTEGMKGARDLFEEKFDPKIKRERRILFLTDMKDLNDRRFENLIKDYSQQNIYTSIIGIGFDFNAAFTDRISRYKGTNYFSATEEAHLQKIIVDQFHYNFFPFAFDVYIDYCLGKYQIDKMYGTPFEKQEKMLNAKWTTFKHKHYAPQFKKRIEFLMLYFKRIKKVLPKPVLALVANHLGSDLVTVCEVNTMTPSAIIKQENKVLMEGGLFLFEMKKKKEEEIMSKDDKHFFVLTCKDEKGNDFKEEYQFSHNVDFQSKNDYFSSTTMQKGMCIYVYVNMLRKLIKNHKEAQEEVKQDNNKLRLNYDDSKAFLSLYCNDSELIKIFNDLGEKLLERK